MNRLIQWIRKQLGIGENKERLAFSVLFVRFQQILALNNQILELMASMDEKLSGDFIFDRQYIRSACETMTALLEKLCNNFHVITQNKYIALDTVRARLITEIQAEISGPPASTAAGYAVCFSEISRDLVDIVGAKSANLAEVRNVLGMNTPEGFVITTKAFHAFMGYNHFTENIASMIHAFQRGTIPAEELDARIHELIAHGEIPPGVKKEIFRFLEALQQSLGKRDLFFAIRSSAPGEGREHSFAGQYRSVLNVPAQRILDAYKVVLASVYCSQVLEYRRQIGMPDDHDVAMAVICQVMVDARVSGVVDTWTPQLVDRDCMAISAAFGLGAPIMSGELETDHYLVSRTPPHDVREAKLGHKRRQLMPGTESGTRYHPVSEAMQRTACLSPAEIERIADTGLAIEKYFKASQDIEFSIDREERIIVLQARCLPPAPEKSDAVDLAEILKDAPVLFSGKGVVAQKGVGAGKVYLAGANDELDAFPSGAILVARFASPRLAKVINKANAIITDVGSPTGHLAAIVREFRVPAILDTGMASATLAPGQEVTVDADDNKVYGGILNALRYHEFSEKNIQEAYEYQLLRRVLKKIAHLNLLHPSDKNFEASSCRTFHDITRFIHEKAVEELIGLNYYRHPDPKAPTRKLKTDIPLDLVLIDIGGGFSGAPHGSSVTPEQIASPGMKAFLGGLAEPGAWRFAPMPVDFKSFMSSLTRTFPADLASPNYIGHNLAVISGEYANISLRLGYHFNMIYFYCSENLNDNYAYFRFFGGVSDYTRRSRRAEFLATVLNDADFRVDIRGDLVVARIKKLPFERLKSKLYILGMLVGYTRQIDVKMVSDDRMAGFVSDFKTLLARSRNAEEADERRSSHA